MKRVWVLTLVVVLGACGHKKTEADITAKLAHEPDKVLYSQAIRDLQKSKFTVSRLGLQTLISTYPDSEYLPQAKYAFAESFIKEGGAANLSQAEVQFKDFITFFPADHKASDAQMMVAMTHIRQMQKADRDNSQAKLAEQELIRLIEGYPDSPLLDEAKAKLRGVEEVLAEGEYKVGSLYLVRKSYPAAINRYRGLLEKYPDYSGTPEVLFALGEALRQSNNEPESATYYSRIVIYHPFSERASLAKQRLTDLKIAIPAADPTAIARGPQQEPVEHGLFAKLFTTMAAGSGVSTETAAASVVDSTSDATTPEGEETGTVSGGVSGTSGSGGNSGASRRTTDSNDTGIFTIDPTKVSTPPPAPKRPPL